MQRSVRLQLVRSSAWACAFAWLGCGTTPTSDAGHGEDVAVRMDSVALDVSVDAPVVADASDASVYPPGPYGNMMGSTLEDLSWVGYANPTGAVVSTMLPYGPTSVDALRGTRHGYALIHLSDFL